MDRANTYAPYAYALMRIVVGLLFAMHGSQKLLGWPGDGQTGDTPPLMMVAGIIELVGGLLIMVGFLTRIAAFLASGTMAVAYFMAHASQGGPLPILNKGELAVVYCFVFLYIAAQGAGIWSIDSMMNRRSPAAVGV